MTYLLPPLPFDCWLFGLSTLQSSFPGFGWLTEPLQLFGDDCWPPSVLGDLFWFSDLVTTSVCFLLRSVLNFSLKVFEHPASSCDDPFSLQKNKVGNTSAS